MRSCLVLFLGLSLAAGSVSRAEAPTYTQAYRIFVKGERVGSESVEEATDAQGNLVSSSRHEVLVSDGVQVNRMSFTTRLVLAKGTMSPSLYSCSYTSGDAKDSYDVTVKNGQVERILRRAGHVSSAKVPKQPDLVLVDFSVYHHYDFLVRRYEPKKGGRQTFHNFIPIIGSDVLVAVTRLDDSSLQNRAGEIPVRNYQIEFVGIFTGTISTDRSGRLVRLVLPQQDLEVLRADVADAK